MTDIQELSKKNTQARQIVREALNLHICVIVGSVQNEILGVGQEWEGHEVWIRGRKETNFRLSH